MSVHVGQLLPSRSRSEAADGRKQATRTKHKKGRRGRHQVKIVEGHMGQYLCHGLLGP